MFKDPEIKESPERKQFVFMNWKEIMKRWEERLWGFGAQERARAEVGLLVADCLKRAPFTPKPAVCCKSIASYFVESVERNLKAFPPIDA